MILNDNIKVNKEFYRQKRSISSKIGNEFEQSIKNSKSIKSRHRKTESSYFLGSYISGDGLDKIINFYKAEFDDNLQNNNKDFHNEQINQKNLNNKITSNKINNYLIFIYPYIATLVTGDADDRVRTANVKFIVF